MSAVEGLKSTEYTAAWEQAGKQRQVLGVVCSAGGWCWWSAVLCACACIRDTLWPVKRKARSCGLKFQTMTQLSSDPEMSCFMLGLKHTDVTASRWPRKDRSNVGSSGCA